MEVRKATAKAGVDGIPGKSKGHRLNDGLITPIAGVAWVGIC
jgi:hypothetical protein